jgi:hypothetical protein
MGRTHIVARSNAPFSVFAAFSISKEESISVNEVALDKPLLLDEMETRSGVETGSEAKLATLVPCEGTVGRLERALLFIR